MLRKLALCVLMIPLPFNGLWMLCHQAPTSLVSEKTAIESDENLFDQLDDISVSMESPETVMDPEECLRVCPLTFSALNGGICLIAPDGKNSMTITVFGVAILPSALSLPILEPRFETATVAVEIELDPFSTQLTPPPEV